MALSALLGGSILLATIFAANESLHKLVHSEAGEPGHQCLITLFAHGQLDASCTVAVAAVLLVLVFSTVPPAKLVVLPATEYQLLPGRGPPSP